MKKVLIADDDPGMLKFLATRCTKMGFEVQTAINGLQALIMASRSDPDVLIVDINLPEVDGLSVSSRLLQPDKKPIDVIVITASSYPETAGRCDGFGAYFVRKGPDLWDGVKSALTEIFPNMAHKIAGEETSPSRVVWERPRVLVVDGDPEVGRFLYSRLNKCGVDMLFTYDAVDGYRMACKEAPSVIITDYLLPNGDARYLLSRLRITPETERTPVFVMSARRLDEATQSILERKVCGQPGAVGFFVKSFDTRELFAALQKFCAFTHNPNPTEIICASSQ